MGYSSQLFALRILRKKLNGVGRFTVVLGYVAQYLDVQSSPRIDHTTIWSEYRLTNRSPTHREIEGHAYDLASSQADSFENRNECRGTSVSPLTLKSLRQVSVLRRAPEWLATFEETEGLGMKTVCFISA